MLEKEQKKIAIEDVSAEAIVTIRCLSAIPAEVEALLAEIAKEEESES